MHSQHVAACTIEPCQQDDLGADLEVAKSFADVRVEHEPGVRRSLVALFRSGVAVNER
jgi:hypothetical protein